MAILISNKWVENPNLPDELQPRMFVDPNVQFTMNLGDLVFRCEDSKFAHEYGAKEQPIVAKVPEEAFLTEIADRGVLDRFKAYFKSSNKTEFISALLQYNKRSYERGTGTV